MAKVEIRIRFDERKFARMIDLVPDHEKGNGQKSKIIYYLVNHAIASLSIPSATKPKSIYSNREYFKKNND